ncbi:hypothetical protein M378DRAFT_73487, partial [Amanita muscaria Koide BX008]
LAPKKGKKITLNEFLGDNAFGSWADEMDALPSAPATKSDDYQPRRQDRFAKGEDVVRASIVDRPGPPREDLPLPTQPPYTAFIGNLAFDLTEVDLETFFSAFNPKSIKIIRDKEEKPKGFGYVEFEHIDGLKDALTKSGSILSGRTIRVSVAEPPKERAHLVNDDDSKFEGPWRREGPLPDLPEREHSRRRFDGLSSQDRSAASDTSSDWRSTRVRIPDVEPTSYKRKGSDSSTPHASLVDKEETWTIGSKFKPFDDTPSTRPAVARTRYDGKDGATDDADWRSAAKSRAIRNDNSPVASNPPTPQLSRRKLELLPRSENVSSSPSPMSSPKMSPASSSRPNPFGAAKPVDVSYRDKEVGERLEREREAVKERFSMSRTSSRGATERTTAKGQVTSTSNQKVPLTVPSTAPTVRPTLSFANVTANKESTKTQSTQSETAVETKSFAHVAI